MIEFINEKIISSFVYFIIYWFIGLLVFIGLFSPVAAVSFPKPTGYVNDFAQIYSSDFKQSVETELAEFEKKTGVEMAVVTLKSLEGMDIESYAVGLFENWKIGKRGQDNGLLLLMSTEDRAVRIEVGYGIEEKITDGKAGEILRSHAIPNFRNNDYEKGTRDTVAAVE